MVYIMIMYALRMGKLRKTFRGKHLSLNQKIQGFHTILLSEIIAPTRILIFYFTETETLKKLYYFNECKSFKKCYC